MAQPVPGRRASAPYALSSDTVLMTPSGTPPHCDPATESRLHQLLANFEAGTHQFCREERESPAERRQSFGERRQSFGSNSDVFPTPPPSRRPSFLSGLAIRPFTSASPSSSSTPAQTPLSASHPKELFSHGFGMTPSDVPLPASPAVRPGLGNPAQHKSTPILPHEPMDAPLSTNPASGPTPAATALPNGGMARSKTTGHTPSKQSGFVLNKQLAGKAAAPGGLVEKHGEDARRHFDPSRDPKLLGLI
ncbi:hypothetical protein IAT38_000267 [Cryptococcus sp. DSM 104549]